MPSRPLESSPPLSIEPSRPQELASSEALVRYLDEVAPLADEENTRSREEVLNELLRLFRQWVRDVCVAKHVYADDESAMEAGGNIFVSGSFKLGVNTPDGDIDAICIAPRHVVREDFFSSLPEVLRAHPGVTEILPIAEAKVPIIELMFNGVQIDLLFASVPLNCVPAELNILDDNILQGLDEASTITLNGPRVTELIFRAVPNPEVFKVVLRTLRLWAKVRGIYSNKMGFLGGVNFAILAAYVCQLFPNYAPATLVHRFFLIFGLNWKWPKPVTLTRPYTLPLGFPVWDPDHNFRDAKDVMPIITPAYPCSNSSYNVSKSTLSVMMDEMARGYDVCESILRSPVDPQKHEWARLFAPSDFFSRFDQYLVLDITADAEQDLLAWKGFVESRVRKLVEAFEYEKLPLSMVYSWPKAYAREEPLEGLPAPAATAAAAAADATASVTKAAAAQIHQLASSSAAGTCMRDDVRARLRLDVISDATMAMGAVAAAAGDALIEPASTTSVSSSLLSSSDSSSSSSSSIRSSDSGSGSTTISHSLFSSTTSDDAAMTADPISSARCTGLGDAAPAVASGSSCSTTLACSLAAASLSPVPQVPGSQWGGASATAPAEPCRSVHLGGSSVHSSSSNAAVPSSGGGYLTSAAAAPLASPITGLRSETAPASAAAPVQHGVLAGSSVLAPSLPQIVSSFGGGGGGAAILASGSAEQLFRTPLAPSRANSFSSSFTSPASSRPAGSQSTSLAARSSNYSFTDDDDGGIRRMMKPVLENSGSSGGALSPGVDYAADSDARSSALFPLISSSSASSHLDHGPPDPTMHDSEGAAGHPSDASVMEQEDVQVPASDEDASSSSAAVAAASAASDPHPSSATLRDDDTASEMMMAVEQPTMDPTASTGSLMREPLDQCTDDFVKYEPAGATSISHSNSGSNSTATLPDVIPAVVLPVEAATAASALVGIVSEPVAAPVDSEKPPLQPPPAASSAMAVDTAASTATSTGPAAPAEPSAASAVRGPMRTTYTYYIGIQPDKERLKSTTLNLTPVLKTFKQTALMSWPGRKEGMIVRQRVLPWKQLPDEVFPAGRAAAAAERVALRAAAAGAGGGAQKQSASAPAAAPLPRVWVRGQPSATAAAPPLVASVASSGGPGVANTGMTTMAGKPAAGQQQQLQGQGERGGAMPPLPGLPGFPPGVTLPGFPPGATNEQMAQLMAMPGFVPQMMQNLQRMQQQLTPEIADFTAQALQALQHHMQQQQAAKQQQQQRPAHTLSTPLSSSNDSVAGGAGWAAPRGPVNQTQATAAAAATGITPMMSHASMRMDDAVDGGPSAHAVKNINNNNNRKRNMATASSFAQQQQQGDASFAVDYARGGPVTAAVADGVGSAAAVAAAKIASAGAGGALSDSLPLSSTASVGAVGPSVPFVNGGASGGAKRGRSPPPSTSSSSGDGGASRGEPTGGPGTQQRIGGGSVAAAGGARAWSSSADVMALVMQQQQATESSTSGAAASRQGSANAGRSAPPQGASVPAPSAAAGAGRGAQPGAHPVPALPVAPKKMRVSLLKF